MAFTIPSADEALAPTVQSQIFETDLSILVAALSQTGVVSGCGVTAQGSPDMTVAVASGTILAAGVSVAVTSGNLTVGAADATNPRVDLISASAAGVKTITAGTAAAVASVKPPDLPSGHIGLAFVYVAATDTAINTNEIVDKRVLLPTPGVVRTALGTTAVGASWDNTTQQVFKKITLATDGFLASINAYVKSNSVSSGIAAYVMSDNAGTPYRVRTVPHGTRDVGGSGGISYGLDIDSNGRWLGKPIGVWLPAGDYWLVVNLVAASGNSCQLAYDTGGSDRTRSGTDVAYDEAVAASSTGTFDHSIYADILR